MNFPKWKCVLLVGAVLMLPITSACNDDDDDDGICTFINGQPKYPDADCDGDGMSNGFELEHGFDPEDPDEDGNGQLDGWDDWDDDGLPNWAEEQLDLDPNNPTTPVDDAEQSELLDGLKDSDGDGAVNMAEAWMASPNLNAKGDTPFLEQLWDPATPADDENPVFQCDPNDEGETLFEDMAFRFHELKIRRPDTIGRLLSGFMGPDIDLFNINIMAPVANFDRGHCVSYFELFAASGVYEEDDSVEGGKVFELEDLNAIEDVEREIPDPTPVRAVVIQTSENTAFFRTTVPLDMVFPGMEPTSKPEETPVEDRSRFLLDLEYLTAAGTLTLNEDGSVSLSAALDGTIPQDKADELDIVMPGGNVTQVGKLTEVVKDRFFIPDKDGEDGKREIGAELRASFKAETVPFNSGD